MVALLSRIQLEHGQYAEVVLRNEEILPRVEDEALAAEIRSFLGQVYLRWGKAAEKAGNTKSQRIRYHYALDYLPQADWRRRLAAANGLAGALLGAGRAKEAAAAYEGVLAQVDDPGVAQQYALYLGRIYREQVQDADKARAWLARADRGDARPLSLEAGYLLADLEAAGGQGDAALKRLNGLVKRGLAGSKWQVPIHYRLAVLHHRGKALEEALQHYEVVAGVEDESLRKLYPRSIAQSKEQVRRIRTYLEQSGGQGGADIAVPKVNAD